ncbi:DUF2989 domain-containing protein [Pseudoalteromonas sp. OFAV1]|jgi:hypothetical protein|uniref:DUF2989 domain-containing protein n=1 Tax=Pseudoalteromonas sp. OFAV1 TaxID=2908892 RepID=UPI001F46CF78|nr:DUF2989 domain-containing protein [Pseudoalteromonas sp. OFAV1]MCF2903002.1 DUF2989 domain-containing protein [Pseudoalteromonas sp. OFAV1]
MKLKILSATLFLSLTSCGEPDIDNRFNKSTLSVEQACSEDPSMCITFKDDSMCKSQRADLIVGNRLLAKEPSGQYAYQQLVIIEKFLECSKRASLIEYVPANVRFNKPESQMTAKEIESKQKYSDSIKQRKKDKDMSYLSGIKLKAMLESDYSDSNNPYMLYYKWSRLRDDSARAQFIDGYKNGLKYNSDLLFHVAEYLITVSDEAAIEALIKSLESYPKKSYGPKKGVQKSGDTNHISSDDGHYHFEIFRALVTLYYKNGEYERAFIFSNLLLLNNDKSSDHQMILLQLGNNEDKISELEDISSNVDDFLKDGLFNSFYIESAMLSF